MFQISIKNLSTVEIDSFLSKDLSKLIELSTEDRLIETFFLPG